MARHVLAIDQGTTSTRSIIFDADLTPIASAQQEFPQHFPHEGHVEHAPADLWRTVRETIHQAMNNADLAASDIAAIGITNQRETTLLWDRRTGAPLAPAIVWQDRRTAETCAAMRAAGHEALITSRTGLLLDPYFSATKLAWLIDTIPGARERAVRGDLAFGTVDTFLVWKLTDGRAHVTDATNAARTMLFDIHRQRWDDDLLAVFDIPRAVLPQVHDTNANFGTTARDVLGAEIPIRAVAGDQQAAAMGQACFALGETKATFGTGAFILSHTGTTAVTSQNRLLTTVAARIDGQTTYALEGSIFVAGAAAQWLRDNLGIIAAADEIDVLAIEADANDPTDGDVFFVPAFTGLGAPHWDPEARGAIFGLTRATGRADLARAALESVALQTADLMRAITADHAASDATGAISAPVLRVDGGMVASDWTMQRLADLLDAPVDRPAYLETTALGVAWLAGAGVGLYPGPTEFAANWRAERQFTPMRATAWRDQRFAGWNDAVARVRSQTQTGQGGPTA
ncbi:MAG: glycerol kinase GlpK [Pseudomonadota bacterium]